MSKAASQPTIAKAADDHERVEVLPAARYGAGGVFPNQHMPTQRRLRAHSGACQHLGGTGPPCRASATLRPHAAALPGGRREPSSRPRRLSVPYRPASYFSTATANSGADANGLRVDGTKSTCRCRRVHVDLTFGGRGSGVYPWGRWIAGAWGSQPAMLRSGGGGWCSLRRVALMVLDFAMGRSSSRCSLSRRPSGACRTCSFVRSCRLCPSRWDSAFLLCPPDVWYGSRFYEPDRAAVPVGGGPAPARPQAGHL